MKCVYSAMIIFLLVSLGQSTAETNRAEALLSRTIDQQLETEGLSAMIVATAVREGRTKLALESLEFKMDTAICTTWRIYQSKTGDEKEMARSVLKQLKEYREKYPRKQDVKVSEGALQTVIEQKTQEAIKILEEFKK